jgi:hypothetical protein
MSVVHLDVGDAACYLAARLPPRLTHHVPFVATSVDLCHGFRAKACLNSTLTGLAAYLISVVAECTRGRRRSDAKAQISD